MRKIDAPVVEPDFGTADMRRMYDLYRDLRDSHNDLVDDVQLMMQYIKRREHTNHDSSH